MMSRFILLTCLAAVLAVPAAGAHPHATVVQTETARCYLVSDGFATLRGNPETQYWVESNGYLGGGYATGGLSEEAGLPVAGAPYWDVAGEFTFGALGLEPGDVNEHLEDGASGLQVNAGPWGAADRRVDALTWAQACFA